MNEMWSQEQLQKRADDLRARLRGPQSKRPPTERVIKMRKAVMMRKYSRAARMCWERRRAPGENRLKVGLPALRQAAHQRAVEDEIQRVIYEESHPRYMRHREVVVPAGFEEAPLPCGWNPPRF